MKKSISIIICALVALGSIAIGISSLSVSAYSSWQEAYLDTLQSARKNLFFESAKSVVIYDLLGDSTPELAYPCSINNSENGSLRIVTFDGNSIKELYLQKEWFLNGGSGSENSFVTLKDGNLATFHYIASDFSNYTYTTLNVNNNSISIDEIINCYYSYDYVNEVDTSKYTINGSSSTEDTCKKKIESLKQKIDKVLMGNVSYTDFVDSNRIKNSPGMNYDEAISYLKKLISSQPSSNSNQLKLSDLSGGYTFASGAGAWSSELFIYKDGSFDGQYSDTDMAPPTIYYSTYNGKFGTPKKLTSILIP